MLRALHPYFIRLSPQVALSSHTTYQRSTIRTVRLCFVSLLDGHDDERVALSSFVVRSEASALRRTHVSGGRNETLRATLRLPQVERDSGRSPEHPRALTGRKRWRPARREGAHFSAFWAVEPSRIVRRCRCRCFRAVSELFVSSSSRRHSRLRGSRPGA